MRKQQGFSSVLLLVFLVLIGLIVGLLYKNYYGIEDNSSGISQQLPKVTQTPETQSPDSTKKSVTSWETYTNDKYYYEVKYPSNWVVKGQDDFVGFSPPEIDVNDPTGKVGIMVEKTNTQIISDAEALSRFQFFMDSCSQVTPTTCTQKNSDNYKLEKQITVDGKLAFQTYGGCCMDIGRHVFLYSGEYFYRITLYHLGGNTSGLENEDVFELILSTFKFKD